MNLIIGVIPTCCSGLRNYPFFVDMKYCVYKIVNTLNDKYYIGVTSIERFNKGYYGSGKLIKLAVKKYSEECFKRIILYKFDDEDRAYQRERQIVNGNLVKDAKCYNLVEGGGHPPKLFGERNPNYGKDMSGENNPRFGKPLSPETIEKISKTWFQSDQEGFWLGKRRCDETKQKISETLKSKHILPPNAKSILQYSLDGKFIKKWRSAHEAKITLGIYHIGKVCKGIRKTAGGYIWKYIDNND